MIVHKRVQSRPIPSWFLPHHGRGGTVEGVSISAHSFKAKRASGVPIDDAWPTPSQRPIPPIDTSGMKNVSPEIQRGAFDVIRENRMIYDCINRKYGTNIEMRVTRWRVAAKTAPAPANDEFEIRKRLELALTVPGFPSPK